MKNNMKISIAIATYNEQENITRCLEAVDSFADEIIIVDGQSSDDTVSLATKFKKVKIISTTNKPIFHINKQMAIDACSSDWILQLDADEVVTPELQKEIISTIESNPTENGFWINRQNYFLGKFLKKGGIYPDATIRLYRKGKGKLPCLDVHEQASIDGSVGHLTQDLLHFSDPNFSRYLLRSDRYTSLLASQLLQEGVTVTKINFIRYFIIKPISWFVLAYFRHRGYVDGFPGFVFAWYSALRFPIAYIKLYEKQKN
jgi:glycosyltransferase involved in cell wall biosynthesis